MSIYSYGSAASGLQFTITTTVVDGNTTFSVEVGTGSLNLNALYWSNGDQVNDDIAGTDLINFTSAKSENSLNMNGANVVWADDGTSTTEAQVYDGGIWLSDAGLGKVAPLTYLTADANDAYSNTYSFTVNNFDIRQFDTLGVRATSTSTTEGSIKWVDDTPFDPPPPVAHQGELLFVENFDYSGLDPIIDPATGTPVAGVVNLDTAHGWTGAAHTELGMNGYGGIVATSGGADGFWLDTQNSPGGINISHTFTDTTAAVDGVTAVLSFDIAVQDLTFNNQHYQADPEAFFRIQVDGHGVYAGTYANLLGSGAPNEMQHFEIEITDSQYNAGDTHTLTLIDSYTPDGYSGFAVDSIAIHDWIV